MARVQTVALVLAVVCGVLGLMTSTGCPVLPEGDPAVVPWLHALVLAVGVAAGFVAWLRFVAIDEERWRVVDDSALTSGEREYAHKEADQQKKTAGIVFLVAPLTLAFWLAYHFRQEDRITAADFMIVTPLVGFGVGLGVGWWWARGRGGGEGPAP